jgi:hypothetical protein
MDPLCLRSALRCSLFPNKFLGVGVLRSFDPHVAREIAVTTVKYLAHADNYNYIATQAHVTIYYTNIRSHTHTQLDWIFECTAYAFTLQQTDFEVINTAKHIYIEW